MDMVHRLRREGRIDEAISACRRAINEDPSDDDAAHVLGLLLSQSGGFAGALEWLQKSIAMNPANRRYRGNLVGVMIAAGRADEAERAAREAVQFDPRSAEAYLLLGRVLEARGDPSSAAECFGQAVALNSSFPDAHISLGNALRRLGRVEEAQAAHQSAIALAPAQSAAHQGLALDLLELGRAAEAAASYQAARKLDPASAALHSALLFTMQYSDRISEAERLEEALRYGSRFAPVEKRPHANARTPGRRLRVGYVSPDLRLHTVQHLIEPVLEAHDRQHVEVFCYASVRQPDDVTARLKRLSDHWIDIARINDAEAAARIRADRIDILVDLTGHMGDNRLPLFALRPAPIQLQIGYPATTGLAGMDFHIADPHCAIAGMEREFTETLLRLPDIGWMYKPCGDYPEVGPLPALKNGFVTFGCLNNPAKISDSAVSLWASVLRAMPSSKMMILSPRPNRHLLDRFANRGIDADRLILTPRQSRLHYLQRLSQIDLALDPSPYTGETTTCDGLWMGVPAVTLTGNSMASRRGASILSNVGLAHWIAQTPEEYVAIAARMAEDLESLSSLRASLRERMRQSPLTDGPRYTGHLEAAYRQIWSAWCAKHLRE